MEPAQLAWVSLTEGVSKSTGVLQRAGWDREPAWAAGFFGVR